MSALMRGPGGKAAFAILFATPSLTGVQPQVFDAHHIVKKPREHLVAAAAQASEC